MLKECHNGCGIGKLVGDYVMLREGIFARVVAHLEQKKGDNLTIKYINKNNYWKKIIQWLIIFISSILKHKLFNNHSICL